MTERPQILVVDDDREIVLGLSVRLRAAGYEVSIAGNGHEGLAAAIDILPDAIVLDIRMPVMDGLTLLTELRRHENTKTIPIVMLSANVADSARSKALNLGASCFLEKPFEAQKLIQRIKTVMDAGPCSAGTATNTDV